MRAISILNKSIVAFLLLFIATTINAQSNTSIDSLPWIHFSWNSDTLSGRLVEKTAMIVPLTINQMPYKFDAQFDLGAVSTMVYGNTFAPYLAQSPDLQKKIKTDRTVLIEGVTHPCFEGLSIKIENVEFPNQSIALFKDFGDVMTNDSIKTPTTKHIGTIAADLFNKKILVIDYKNQKLCSINSLPQAWIKNINFVDIEYIKEMNWIFLPLQIGDSVRKVMFDTGSSIFPLLSSPSKIAQISNADQCIDSLSISSWGNEEVVHGYTPKENMSLGTTKFNSLPIYSSKGLDDESLDGAGFWGIVGNRYFLDKIIVIDYKNQRFGILQEN